MKIWAPVGVCGSGDAANPFLYLPAGECKMKRSEINEIMQEADDFIRSRGFTLPRFAYWTPDDWTKKGPEVSEIVRD